jgi:hypothetical protein
LHQKRNKKNKKKKKGRGEEKMKLSLNNTEMVDMYEEYDEGC